MKYFVELDGGSMKQHEVEVRSELISKIIDLRPIAYNSSRIFARYEKETTTFLEQELDYLRMGLPNSDDEGNWLYSKDTPPKERIDVLLDRGIINDEQYAKLIYKYQIADKWAIKDRGELKLEEV